MPALATPADVRQALVSATEIAIVDLRPEAVYAQGHPLFACSMPLDRLEREAPEGIPRLSTPIITYGSTPAEAAYGAARLSQLGYCNVRILAGGVAAWARAGEELFADVNSPSKAFGELVAERLSTPFVNADELHALLESGAAVTVLDGRRFEEFQTMSIPTAASAPNATLVRHVGSLPVDDELVVVNCAGRTRSIIGAQTLVHSGLRPRVAALRNGTIGWSLAGLELEHGQTRRAEGVVSPRAATAARRFADRAGVARITSPGLSRLLVEERTVYRFDVRSPERFRAGHIDGFRSAPGGQLLQETDSYAPVRGATIVLTDDDRTEADVTAAWLAQMGWRVMVLDGVRAADMVESLPAATPRPARAFLGSTVTKSVGVIELEQQLRDGDAVVIDLAPFARYCAGHIPGAVWASRAALLIGIGPKLPRSERYVLTSDDTVLLDFAVTDLSDRLPGTVVGLAGGTDAWVAAGLHLDQTARVTLSPPLDRYRRPYEGTDVPASAMQAYLDWEAGLVTQLERDGTHHFRVLEPL